MLSPSEADQQAMLDLARQAIREAVCNSDLPQHVPNDGLFGERCGVFVSLQVQRRLRGCIGVIGPPGDTGDGKEPSAIEPLGSAIVRCAATAALSDPRFPRLSSAELPGLQIEISLLSALVRVRAEEIELGRHGVVACNGKHRGVLLPQVATEHGFTVEQFLAEACRKARLPAEAWRHPGTELLGFTCFTFSDVTVSSRNAPSLPSI